MIANKIRLTTVLLKPNVHNNKSREPQRLQSKQRISQGTQIIKLRLIPALDFINHRVVKTKFAFNFMKMNALQISGSGSLPSNTVANPRGGGKREPDGERDSVLPEDRSTTSPSGIAEDVFVKVGKVPFSADFIVVDYVVDPRVPLILGRPFLRMARALIDVYGEELTLRVDDEAITFKVVKLWTTPLTMML
ncbi:reverse transcriptase domain-containing protein [Tanacetum coccineum]|uniref:Reverse transcriptase domain-containing protein n=1 Tax=Tanacetum coccineum TaxID=301880 RepID=A0ABQ5C425_9ASTR